MLETVSVFDAMELDNTQQRVASRRALALAHHRVEASLGRFLRGARSEEEFLERLALVQEDFGGYVTTAANEVGHDHPEHIAAALKDHYRLALDVKFEETPEEEQEKDEEEEAKTSSNTSKRRVWAVAPFNLDPGQPTQFGNSNMPNAQRDPNSPGAGSCPGCGKPSLPGQTCPECDQAMLNGGGMSDQTPGGMTFPPEWNQQPGHMAGKQGSPLEVRHPDNPEPYVYDDNVPPDVKTDLQHRFDGGGVVKHPEQPGTYIQGPENWWDGHREVTDLGDRQYGFRGYDGPKRFDQTGNNIGDWNGLGPVDQHGAVDADPNSPNREWAEKDRAAQEAQRLQDEEDHASTWHPDYGYLGSAQNPSDQKDTSPATVTCPECGGDGKQAGVNRCGKCKGNGKVPNFGDSLLDATFGRVAENHNNTDLGGPEPKMDKRQWTPSNPAKPESDGKMKDIVEPIKATNEKELSEIDGDGLKTEKLPANSDDAGFDDGGENHGPHTKTFGDKGQTNPVTRESLSGTNPLSELLQAEWPSDQAVTQAFSE